MLNAKLFFKQTTTVTTLTELKIKATTIEIKIKHTFTKIIFYVMCNHNCTSGNHNNYNSNNVQ